MSKKEVKLVKKLELMLKQLNQREYLHHFGPKKFKFVNHALALLMKENMKCSFRRVNLLLDQLGIKVPTYSALCKSRKRIPISLWNSLLKITSGINHKVVAVDSTGFSLSNPRYHYVKRINRREPVKSYAKLSTFLDLKNKEFTALKIRIKPRHDIKDIDYLLRNSSPSEKLIGDSAYDAESLHEKCFESSIQTIIKPRKNVKKGFYRKKQMKNYSEKEYHQRSLIESEFGATKRKYGSYVLGKSSSSIKSEIYCKAICHNLMLRN